MYQVFVGHSSIKKPKGEEVSWCQISYFPWSLWAAALSAFYHGSSLGVECATCEDSWMLEHSLVKVLAW
jgi:hypothetical protein